MTRPLLPHMRETFDHHFPATGARFLAAAPGRLNVIGEHTDYNGLPVLPFAIDAGIQILFSPVDEPRITLHALDYPESSPASFEIVEAIPPSGPGHWINYIKAAAQDAVAFARERGGEPRALRGFRGVVAGDVPRNAGLSSSSALVVASALAVFHSQGWSIAPEALAERCAAAEHYVGTRGGGMDQSTSLCGRKNACLKMYFHPLKITLVTVNVECSFLVAHSRVEAAKSAGARHHYNQRVLECRLLTELISSEALRAGAIHEPLRYLGDLRRMWNTTRFGDLDDVAPRAIPEAELSLSEIERRIGRERMQDILHPRFTELVPALPATLPLRRRVNYLFMEWHRVEVAAQCIEEGDLQGLGAMLYSAHDGLARYYEVSHPKVDELIELAREFGLPGARMVGAGFGGITVHLVPLGQEKSYTEFLSRRFYGEDPADVAGRFVFIFHPEDGASVEAAG